MASGKSYTGKRLGELLGRPFYDLDHLIEKQAGKAIRLIFEEDGEPYFRQLEREVLLSTDQLGESVIATGGGAPCFHENMDWMNRHGLTIYLKTPPQILWERLIGEKNHRPLVRSFSESELLAHIEQLMDKRSVYYEMAHVVFQVNSADDPVAEQLHRYFHHLIGH